ncbi:MAG: PQQ-binding-like beta-propeller repeat protein, partial [Planctomycetaceae bacterium]|nr:PQQ-binding-like beta-propeller repeat protein [Planctomycetaceae bacterium]
MNRPPAASMFASLVCLTLLTSSSLAADPVAWAQQVREATGVQGGFVVHLGPSDIALTAALRQSDAFQVQALLRDPATVQAARATLLKQGVYGDVSVDLLPSGHLPYVDNLVNLLVVEEGTGVSPEEINRVLVPNGRAYVRRADDNWTLTIKPRPDSIDDWSHYLHDASGNAVAHDTEVAQPRHLQWVGSPRWSRHHDRMASMSALVSTNGRMFYVMDEGSRISIQLPSHWKLIARDAFNGTVLWKRDIKDWQSHLWPLKSGPTSLARRLVSTDDEVYCTLAYKAPLTAMNAATGETLREYEGSLGTEEVIHSNGQLFVVCNKGEFELEEYAPLFGVVGDQGRVAKEFSWNEEARVVMAFDAATGKQLWAKQTRVAPLTLSADDGRVYLHDGEKLVALNRETGEPIWTTDPLSRRPTITFNFGPRLVIHNDVVLFAGGDGKLSSLDAATGELLWSGGHANSGYQSPQDLMVIDGLVWVAPTTSGKDSGIYTGRDPRTGEVKKEFKPDVDTYWFHHRCYIAKATDKFIIPSRTGVEFVDFEQEHWDIHHWVRGGCLYGVMPCNGLTYTPPHNCACYPEAKLYGFNALAPAAPTRPWPVEVPEAGRLEQGPAYGTELVAASEESYRDWPTYRANNERNGSVTEKVPHEQLATKWTAKLGGRLSAPVIADNVLYVAQIDQHTLHALDATTGKSLWRYTIGARIDSPPTIAHGRAFFGGADGYVYCLRVSDGALVWRFRAAAEDRRLMAYEQLESVWPVHGATLVRDKVVYAVAGRSMFLDGGLRLVRLDLESGKLVDEQLLDDKNPATGNNLQEVLQTLQMPVGLPDILSADDRFVYMRSQKFDFDGNRLEIGPVSGDFQGQGGAQRGDGVHLFAPMGYLDDSWFHRSYWVFGRNFAGGHGGYYQAGKFAPAGRILVNGNGYVYGYGRKPQYYRWTTVLEHQLFAAPPEPPAVEGGRGAAASTGSQIGFSISPNLNAQGKPITVEAWVNSTRPAGVILARGGPQDGFALTLEQGKPQFHVRSNNQLTTISGSKRIVGDWHHVAAVLQEDKSVTLYVDGESVATGTASGLLAADPKQPMEIGADGASAVGDYEAPLNFTGTIDEVRLYYSAVDAEGVAQRYKENVDIAGEAVLVLDFNDGTARDLSPYRNNGDVQGAEPVEGRFGNGMKFTGAAQGRGKRGVNQQSGSHVQPKWTTDVPIYVRSMALAERTIFIVGPADTIDEEVTFEKLTQKEGAVEAELARQDAILAGAEGSKLLAVNADTGETE